MSERTLADLRRKSDRFMQRLETRIRRAQAERGSGRCPLCGKAFKRLAGLAKPLEATTEEPRS